MQEKEGKHFIDLGVQQIQNHKKCLQVKVDIPAAINKNKKNSRNSLV